MSDSLCQKAHCYACNHVHRFLAVKKDGKYITEHSLTSTETVRWHCSGKMKIVVLLYLTSSKYIFI